MERKKLNSVLLIDDDEATNFLHKAILNMADCTEKCFVVENGQEALDFLTSEDKEKCPKPDLIFLDINMPKMNGWEFLENYEKLSEDQRGEVVLVMLTTSINPDDAERADNIELINGFVNKSLTIEAINGILEKYFSS